MPIRVVKRPGAYGTTRLRVSINSTVWCGFRVRS
ncbi:hypothetical protein FOXYSP1_19449 [Fusarium oxysporum f. sp. phaseoli]